MVLLLLLLSKCFILSSAIFRWHPFSGVIFLFFFVFHTIIMSWQIIIFFIMSPKYVCRQKKKLANWKADDNDEEISFFCFSFCKTFSHAYSNSSTTPFLPQNNRLDKWYKRNINASTKENQNKQKNKPSIFIHAMVHNFTDCVNGFTLTFIRFYFNVYSYIEIKFCYI